MKARLSIDLEADAAYLKVSDNTVVRTSEVSPGVQVDLDEYNMVVGVEVLALDVEIPVEELTTKYHMREEQMLILGAIRPSVTSFVARQVNSGGVTMAGRTVKDAGGVLTTV